MTNSTSTLCSLSIKIIIRINKMKVLFSPKKFFSFCFLPRKTKSKKNLKLLSQKYACDGIFHILWRLFFAFSFILKEENKIKIVLWGKTCVTHSWECFQAQWKNISTCLIPGVTSTHIHTNKLLLLMESRLNIWDDFDAFEGLWMLDEIS